MNKYFSQLRPLERRLAVGVLVVVFLVLNWWFVWPEFSDWNDLDMRRAKADQKLASYEKVISQSKAYEKLVKELQTTGETIPPEEQGIDLQRTVLTQSIADGLVTVSSSSRPITRTNDEFFVEHVLNVNLQATTDAQLVDFLYKLGNDASMIRVRDLELSPDAPHQHLNANLRLVASYQKSAPAKSTPAKTVTATVKAKAK